MNLKHYPHQSLGLHSKIVRAIKREQRAARRSAVKKYLPNGHKSHLTPSLNSFFS